MTLLNEYALSCNSFPGTPTFEDTEQDDEVKTEDNKPKQEETADVKKD